MDNQFRGFAIRDKKKKLQKFEACLDTIVAQLPSKSDADSFDNLLLRNFYALAQESAVYTEDHIATSNIRDAQMAANLDWLANTKFKDEKIIVWAASSHIAKGKGADYLVQGRLPAAQQMKLRTQLDAIHLMGRVFTEDPRNRAQTYSLGFTSKAGASQRSVSKAVTILPEPSKNSLENWMPDNVAYAFINLQPLQSESTAPEYFAMRGTKHYEIYADWPRFFDGIFYLRTMEPCKRNKYAPVK